MFESITSIKVSEKYFKCLKSVCVTSRSVQADHVLVHPNRSLTENSQGLIYECNGLCLGGPDAK